MLDPYENITGRLTGVRYIGDDRAMANCSSHDDKSPSLSIRRAEDGKVLLHCFAGCSASEVLAGIGLELKDLFPEPIKHHSKGTRPNHWHAAREALKTLHSEVLICAIAAQDIAAGKSLSKQDADRVFNAAIRIREAAEQCR